MNAPPNPPENASPKSRPGFSGSGGTEGGVGMFFVGLVLSGVSLWLFLDSVRVTSDGHGLVSGMLMSLRSPGGGGGFQTTSLGIIFVPFFCGVFALFYNAKQKWAWWLTGIGVAIVTLEILSRIQFSMSMKTSHLLLMIATFACGTALMLRSYRELPSEPHGHPPDESKK